MEIRKPIIKKNDLKRIKLLPVASAGIEVGDAILEEGNFENLEIEELAFNGVIAENLLLSLAKVGEVTVIDSVLTKCDFSGTVLKNLSLERVEIHKSRVQGTQCMDTVFKDVVIKDSKCIQASFRFSTMKNILFVDCDMSNADFQGSLLENVMFQNCNLKGSQFSSTKLTNVDISSSDIEDIKINKESFGKVIVNTSQAMYLSSIFGMVIEN